MAAGILALGVSGAGSALPAQSCTTQSKLGADVRSSLTSTALELAADVKAGDATKVWSAYEAGHPEDFGPTSFLVRSTGEKLGDDTLRATQVYELDALGIKADPEKSAEVDFVCLLAGTAAETDFSVAGLPPGLYGFVMVEAEGVRPWLLSFLLKQEGGRWKMAGFYPHARTAAGHDGLWYWSEARAAAKDKDLWQAWLFYGEADQLLRPSNFVSSTNLDRLRAEQTAASPAELAGGIGQETPLVLKDNGQEYRLIRIEAQGSEDGKRLDLMLHLQAAGNVDSSVDGARNKAVAKAFLDAHVGLRKVFDGVWVFAEQAGKAPFVTDFKMEEIP